jgi:hypothetical protein
LQRLRKPTFSSHDHWSEFFNSPVFYSGKGCVGIASNQQGNEETNKEAKEIHRIKFIEKQITVFLSIE